MIEELFTEESIQSIISWAESAEMPKEPFQLSDFEHFDNPQGALAVDLNLVKMNYKDKIHLCKPAILRLNRMKEYLE